MDAVAAVAKVGITHTNVTFTDTAELEGVVIVVVIAVLEVACARTLFWLLVFAVWG